MTTETTNPSLPAGPAGKSDSTTGVGTGTGTGTRTGTTVQASTPGVHTPAATRGRTTIADGVVEKIAGLAAREVPGVYALGGGFARTLGAVRERVPGGRSNVTRGVKVEVGERQTAVDLDLVVAYGVPITEVAGEVRENVISAVERMTGLEVVEVNVAVVDVRLPDDEEPQESEARVR